MSVHCTPLLVIVILLHRHWHLQLQMLSSRGEPSSTIPESSSISPSFTSGKTAAAMRSSCLMKLCLPQLLRQRRDGHGAILMTSHLHPPYLYLPTHMGLNTCVHHYLQCMSWSNILSTSVHQHLLYPSLLHIYCSLPSHRSFCDLIHFGLYITTKVYLDIQKYTSFHMYFTYQNQTHIQFKNQFMSLKI